MPKIAAGATNKNISIAPNGTGKVVVGTGAADATVQSDGDHNLILQTGNSTTSKIEINDGANGDVAITPNGTGNLTIDNIAISDNTIKSTDTNGNIDLTPNGTGEVNISKVDIDGGAIDGTDVTVGSGKTLDVSAGSLTSSTAQKQAIVDGADIEGTDILSTGESGTFLGADGDDSSSWQSITGTLPSQTGKADDLLTTDGTTASWTNAPINLVKLAFAGQSSAPGAPSAGTVYYDSTANVLKVYNGTVWEQLTDTALGGIITTYVSGATTYAIHTFLSSGTFTVRSSFNVDYLVVAGGGGGGVGHSSGLSAGGGGAGGFRTGTSHAVTAQVYGIVVGAGGNGSDNSDNKGSNGFNSSFSSIVATGGGGGGSYGNGTGAPGGSGGGSGGINGHSNAGGASQPVTSPVQGYAGGNGTSSSNAGTGGGGAAAVGNTDAGTSLGGAGGAGEDEVMGLSSANSTLLLVAATNAGVVSGSTRYIAGGGGGSGGTADTYAAGGLGGGGAGNQGVPSTGWSGVVNSGGGGGGGVATSGTSGGTGGIGGSGIVIIRYAI